MVRERLAKCVAVMLLPELCKNGQDKAAPPELEPEVFRNGLRTFRSYCASDTVYHTVCGIKYIPQSNSCQLSTRSFARTETDVPAGALTAQDPLSRSSHSIVRRFSLDFARRQCYKAVAQGNSPTKPFSAISLPGFLIPHPAGPAGARMSFNSARVAVRNKRRECHARNASRLNDESGQGEKTDK